MFRPLPIRPTEPTETKIVKPNSNYANYSKPPMPGQGWANKVNPDLNRQRRILW